jgi:hypothetical protein
MVFRSYEQLNLGMEARIEGLRSKQMAPHT